MGGRLSKVMKARLPRWDWVLLRGRKASPATRERSRKEATCKPGSTLSRTQHLDLGLLSPQNRDKQTSAGSATRPRYLLQQHKPARHSKSLAWDSHTTLQFRKRVLCDLS